MEGGEQLWLVAGPVDGTADLDVSDLDVLDRALRSFRALVLQSLVPQRRVGEAVGSAPHEDDDESDGEQEDGDDEDRTPSERGRLGTGPPAGIDQSGLGGGSITGGWPCPFGMQPLRMLRSCGR